MKDWVVILKFHYGKRGSVNPIISKTMGRVAVINHSYEGAMPQAGSFWLCRIDGERKGQHTSGCFIVTPVRVVGIDQIVKLIPGTYEVEVQGSNVICRPKLAAHYWIAPFSIKKFFIKKDKAPVQYQSVIVPLQDVESVEKSA